LSGGNTIANGTTVFVPGPVILGNSLVNARADVRSLASARGRLGYAASNWMLYGTGGVAWADVDYNASFTCSPGGVPAGCIGTFFAQTSLNKTHTGWVAGGGVEFKSAGSPLMLGVEYLYYGFESAQLAAPLTGVGGATGWTFNELDIHVVRARLSYKVW
jgi:outer membrane immunogenic protein